MRGDEHRSAPAVTVAVDSRLALGRIGHVRSFAKPAALIKPHWWWGGAKNTARSGKCHAEVWLVFAAILKANHKNRTAVLGIRGRWLFPGVLKMAADPSPPLRGSAQCAWPIQSRVFQDDGAFFSFSVGRRPGARLGRRPVADSNETKAFVLIAKGPRLG